MKLLKLPKLPRLLPKFNLKEKLKEKFNLELKWLTIVKSWFILLVTLYLVLIHPVIKPATRVLAIIIGLIMIGLLVIKMKRKRIGKLGLVVIFAIFIVTMVINPKRLTKDSIYILQGQKAESYVNTKFLRNGENFIGIDSAGLIRRSVIDANMQAFYNTKSISYFVKSLNIWLNDCDTKNMYNNHMRMFVDIQKFNSNEAIDFNRLKIGDIMIDGNTFESSIFIDPNTWVSVNENSGKVVIENSPRTHIKSGKIIRWK